MLKLELIRLGARLSPRILISLERLCIGCAAFVVFAGIFHSPIKSLYSLGFVKYYPWLILAFIACALPFLLHRRDFKKHDIYLLLYVLFASVSSLFHGGQDITHGISIMIRYVLPASMYFVFGHLNVSERFSHSVIIYFAIFLALITITEFLFQNILGITVFNYGGSYDVTAAGVRYYPAIFAETLIKNEIDVSVKFIRARGSTQYAQITGCLHAALILYFLALCFLRKNTIWPKIYIYLLLLISSISLYMTGSGTGLLVLAMGICLLIYFRFNINKRKLFLLSLFFVAVVFFFAIDGGHLKGYYNQAFLILIKAMKNYVGYMNLDNFINILFGFQDYGIVSQYLSTETHLFNELVEIGLVAYLFLMLLLGNYFFIAFKTYRFTLENTLGLALIVLALFVGSIHYECMFTLPANLLLFMAMGLSLKYFRE